MRFFAGQPVAYTASTATNMRDLETFFDVVVRQPGGGEFLSDLSIVQDGIHKFIVVRERKAGPIVSYALLRQVGPDAEVEQLYATHRGRGHGHLALATAEAVAKAHGATQLRLDAVPQATAFYDHEGYMSTDGYTYVKRL